MFERFTDRARRVIVLAQDEARELRDLGIGPEHLLLGLLKGDGLARQALTECGISYESTRDRVARACPGKPEAEKIQKLPFRPQSKKVLELSLREALRLGHNYIGTEHLLLGLIRGAAAELAQIVDVDTTQIELRVMEQLSAASLGPARSPALRQAMDRARQAAGRGPMNTGHVVAGILADPDSQAARALAALGASAEPFEAALAQVAIDGTTDAAPQPSPVEIKVGDLTVRVQDPDLFLAAKDLTSDQILDALKRGLAGLATSEPPSESQE
jgi:ATP-dependent Clp protease ATP-binding subunit ClpA